MWYWDDGEEVEEEFFGLGLGLEEDDDDDEEDFNGINDVSIVVGFVGVWL